MASFSRSICHHALVGDGVVRLADEKVVFIKANPKPFLQITTEFIGTLHFISKENWASRSLVQVTKINGEYADEFGSKLMFMEFTKVYAEESFVCLGKFPSFMNGLVATLDVHGLNKTIAVLSEYVFNEGPSLKFCFEVARERVVQILYCMLTIINAQMGSKSDLLGISLTLGADPLVARVILFFDESLSKSDVDSILYIAGLSEDVILEPEDFKLDLNPDPIELPKINWTLSHPNFPLRTLEFKNHQFLQTYLELLSFEQSQPIILAQQDWKESSEATSSIQVKADRKFLIRVIFDSELSTEMKITSVMENVIKGEFKLSSQNSNQAEAVLYLKPEIENEHVEFWYFSYCGFFKFVVMPSKLELSGKKL